MNAGYGDAQPLLKTGLDTADQTYAKAIAPFQTNLQATQPGQTAYANATGANGPQGYASAVSNFQNAPGYQFALDQGSQNVIRNQAQVGGPNSGATELALQQQGQGAENQQWQQYISNLLPFVGASTQNAGGAGAIQTNQANLQNANYGTQAQLAFTKDTGIGNAQASADLAKNTASANMINALTAFL